ncbi:glycosyl transferase group 1 [Acidimicrobium ferrooxidans DSM 10331]|uniref:Glycosyl transferase group 1 n=1 Tax=Acidimicrobium ferrooxidans (strain DSM 10331 / JCM 15462 / NBRC 103882 / ICP) TaxID=525909 RepID=C7LYR8_ACIFD|nr:glycosyltransferase family 4 protein [Acidimicrobium ferrooxidans]ACU53876.1 glycosyl transferase group 1 [Acidimicrobium ferrooxidans DSM 10331]
MRHVLVTNDFPPKIGGIQHYLGEIYRRLDPTSFVVVTRDEAGAEAFDRAFGARVVRVRGPLLPTRALAARVRGLAREIDADLVVIDPIWPLGEVAASLGLGWVGVAHGAELTLPLRLWPTAGRIRSVLAGALGVVAAGGFVARALDGVVPADAIATVPPGVDLERFCVGDRERARKDLMVDPERSLVLFVSRLVPRKGAHIVIDAVAQLHRPVELHVVGDGRSRSALEQRARRRGILAVFEGRVALDRLVASYQAADVVAFPAHDRWFGLEEEGFGIVALEAQACGVPVVVGVSGGTAEAVDPASGRLVASRRPRAWAEAIEERLAHTSPPVADARGFVERHHGYDRLADEWHAGLERLASRGRTAGSG